MANYNRTELNDEGIGDSAHASQVSRKSLGSRLFSGGMWMVASRGVQALSGIIVSMLLARMLSPGDMGTYFILASIALLGSTFAQFGIQHSIVKLIAGGIARGSESEVRRSLRSVLVVAICGSAIIAGGYAAGAGTWLASHVFKSQSVAMLTGLTATWIVLRHGQMFVAKAFRGFHDLRYAALYEGAQAQFLTVVLLAALWFYVDRASLDKAVQATVLALLLTLITGGVLLWKRHWSKLAPAKGTSIGSVVRLSAPLFVSSISLLALGEMHLWILGSVSTTNQVAIYGASYRLMKLVELPLSLVNQIIPPMIAELFVHNRKKPLERLLRSTASVIALPALIVLLLLFIFAGDVLQIIYGEFYKSGAIVLAIMAAGQAINVWTGSPGMLLAMTDQQNMLMRASVLGGAIGLLITSLLVHKYGALGVAIGYTSGLVIQNISMSWLAWRRLGIRSYAGIGQLRDPWFWIRGEVARRTTRHRLYKYADNLLRPLENIYCTITRTQIVECLGDSHTNVFTRVNRMGCNKKIYFRLTIVQGATAFGLGNPESHTNAYNIFVSILSKLPTRRTVIFLLGEVDMGYLVWMKAQKDMVAPSNVMDEALDRYFKFVKPYVSNGCRVALMSAPLPAVRDKDMDEPMEIRRPGLNASQRERTDMTLAYNARLREWSSKNGVYFIDLDSSLLDRESRLLRDEYYNRRRIDNHLDAESFARLVCNKVSKSSFATWINLPHVKNGLV